MKKNEKVQQARREYIEREMVITHSDEGRAAKVAELEKEIEYFKTCPREKVHQSLERISKQLFISEKTIIWQM